MAGAAFLARTKSEAVMILPARSLAFLFLSLAPVCGFAADEPEPAAAARKARLAQIRGVLETLRPTLLDDDRETAASLNSTPLLLYSETCSSLGVDRKSPSNFTFLPPRYPG
jgi:hypothetical protein